MKLDALYLDALELLEEGVYITDMDRKIMYWNHGAEVITGYSKEEIIGRRCVDKILSHIDAGGRPLCEVSCPLYYSMMDGVKRTDNVFLRRKDGIRISTAVKTSPAYYNGEIVGGIEVFSPNSSAEYQDTLIQQLSDMAMRDGLTKLPNRRYLQSFLEYRYSEYKRFGTPFAVLFLDIDDFRNFNNVYGHEVGDKVLVTLANSFKGKMRRSDMMGRWGGEEFLGIYTIKGSYEVNFIAEKVRLLAETAEIDYKEKLQITASIGITSVKETDTLDSIIERADQLMYFSKNNGKNRYTSDFEEEKE